MGIFNFLKETFFDKVKNLFNNENIELKEKIEQILKSGDKHIKESEVATGDIDFRGFTRVKKELESMGLVVAYKVYELPSFDVIIAIWEDKNELPPLYVEVTVSEKEE